MYPKVLLQLTVKPALLYEDKFIQPKIKFVHDVKNYKDRRNL